MAISSPCASSVGERDSLAEVLAPNLPGMDTAGFLWTLLDHRIGTPISRHSSKRDVSVKKQSVVTVLVGLGLTLILLLVLGYWFWIRPVPNYPLIQRPMPKPNARDDFMAAARISRATGGSSILGPDGKPLRRNGLELHGASPGLTRQQLRRVVIRNRRALARLRQGFGKQFGSPPARDLAAQFPELAHFRDLARVLVAEGKLAEQEGRMGDAARSYLDCLRLGTMVPRGGPLIHGLVGLAIQSIGLHALEGAIDRLDAPTAAAAVREMTRLDEMNIPLAETLTEEREVITASMQAFIHDPGGTLQRMNATDGAQGPDAESRSAMQTGMRLMPKKWIVDNMRGYMDRIITASRQPYHARPPAPRMPKDPLNRILLPVFDPIPLKWAQRDAFWRIAQTRLALRAYQQRHRAALPSLAALVPAYLPAVPQDPFAAAPLVYGLQGSRGIVYSRGPDGDDDGGIDLGSRVQPGSNGDIASMKVRKGR
jgi:hypothetical protein